MPFSYETEVNKGSINMRALKSKLNDWGAQGWELDQIFEQGGNTILIFRSEY